MNSSDKNDLRLDEVLSQAEGIQDRRPYPREQRGGSSEVLSLSIFDTSIVRSFMEAPILQIEAGKFVQGSGRLRKYCCRFG